MSEMPSKLTLQEFAKAMSQLDLSSVPEEKRQSAVVDHFWKIMCEAVATPENRAEILRERLRRRYAARTRTKSGLILPS
jgi:hypothetical protein